MNTREVSSRMEFIVILKNNYSNITFKNHVSLVTLSPVVDKRGTSVSKTCFPELLKANATCRCHILNQIYLYSCL